MRRTILTWGLLVGVLSISLMLGSLQLGDRFGIDDSMALGYAALLLAGLLAFAGIRSYRDQVAGGRLTFGRGFLVGVGIALVAALCYGILWAVVYANFMPDFCDKYAARMIEKTAASGASETALAEVRAQAAEMKRLMQNPVTNAAMAFLEPFPVGILVSLVSAAFLRKK